MQRRRAANRCSSLCRAGISNGRTSYYWTAGAFLYFSTWYTWQRWSPELWGSLFHMLTHKRRINTAQVVMNLFLLSAPLCNAGILFVVVCSRGFVQRLCKHHSHIRLQLTTTPLIKATLSIICWNGILLAMIFCTWFLWELRAERISITHNEIIPSPIARSF